VKRGSDPLRMKRVVIDKKMDFAAFRRYLGAGSMRIEEALPAPTQVFEPEQPIVVSAKIPNHQTLDPKSIGMALISSGTSTAPFSYDPKDGSISMVLHEALDNIRGKYQRALVWATDMKTGKRVEASWTFKVPDAILPQTALPTVQPATVAPAQSSVSAPAPAAAPAEQPAVALAATVPVVVPPMKHTPKK